MPNTPFLPDFEVEVLRNMVVDGQFLKQSIPIVRDEFFAIERNAKAFNVISQTYTSTRQAPSRINFLSGLVRLEESAGMKIKEKDRNTLILEPCTQLADALYNAKPKSIDVEARWIDFCRQREMENIHIRNLDEMNSGEIDYHAAVENINKTYRRINTSNQGGIDVSNNIDTFAERMLQQKKKKLATGFPLLDKRCGGGLNIETLLTFVAQSKGGKSMFQSNVGHNVLSVGKNVVQFTLEISQEEYELRYCSRATGIKMDDVGFRAPEMAELWAKWFLEHRGQLFVKGWPSGTVGVAELKNYLYWLESEKGIRPDLINVDYGDLLLARTNYKEERLKLKEIWTELRALAFEFHCPVITGSQTKREGFDRAIIRMQDVAEDIQKVNISDYILTGCKTQDEDAQNKMRIFLAGSRAARAGLVVPITFDWERAFMAESTDKLQQSEVFN